MSILNRLNVSKVIGDARKVATTIGVDMGDANKFISPIVGAPYDRPRTTYEYRDPNKPNPNIELIYDYFKNIKSKSLSTYLPGLNPEEMAKAVLSQFGYNMNVVPVYEPMPTGIPEIIDIGKDLFEDPVKGLMRAYDFIKTEKYKHVFDGYLKDEKVSEVIGPLNGSLEMSNVNLPPDIVKPEKDPPRGGFPIFRGWHDTRDIELWSSHLWDVTIKPYKHKNSNVCPPDVPKVNDTDFVPISSFEFTDDVISPFNIEMSYGSTIAIPESKPLVRSIRLSILDTIKDGVRQWKNWMKDYKDFMIDDHKVTPYKHCCMEITLYTLNTEQGVMTQETYLGIPTNLDSSYQGNQYGSEEFMIDFSVVGQIK